MNQDLEKEPRMPADEDRRAITALINSYAHHIDTGDFAGLGRLFAHGSWNNRTGSAEAEAYLHRNMIRYSDGTPRTAHMITNVAINLTGEDTAEATSCIVVYLQPDGADVPRPLGCLDYHDWFWKPTGSWAYRHRQVAVRFGDFTGHLRQPPPPASGASELSNEPLPPAESDVEALHRLQIAYARLLDAADFAGFARLFRDGVWDGLSRAEEIKARLEASIILYDGSPCTMRAITNTNIDVDGDTARSSSTATVFQMTPSADRVSVIAVNDYQDRFVRGSQGWAWSSRAVRPRLVGDISSHVRAT